MSHPNLLSVAPASSLLDERVDQRLTDLEIKSAFAEDMLDELNQTIVRQQQQIDLLVREVLRLQDQREAPQPGFLSLRDELPPHY
jgi:SlyX protein